MPYSSEIDPLIGIYTRLNNSPRKKCAIKKYPESFIVEEVLDDTHIARAICENDIPDSEKRGIWQFVMVKKNLTTMEAIEIIRRKVNIPPYLVGTCGLKDKHALTAQYVTMSGIWPSMLRDFYHDKLFIRDFERVEYGLYKGAHKGNKFRIILFMKDGEKIDTREVPYLFANFYGYQRFGSKRPVSHVIGKYLLQEKYENAAWLYLTLIGKWESNETKLLRKRIKEEGISWDLIKQFPRHLIQEKKIAIAILKGRIKKIKRIFGRELYNLIISAYQSYLFNKILSRLIMEGIVSEKTLDLNLPLITRDFECPPGDIGRIYKEVLDEENINPSSFHFERSQRRAVERAYDVKVKYCDEGPVVEFFLEKGAYATSYLREYVDMLL